MITLEQARTEHGISKIAVARKLGITRQTYAVYEKSPERMTVEQAKAVCDFIGCDFESIFFGRDV